MNLLTNLFQSKGVKTSAAAFWEWFSANSKTIFQLKSGQQDILDSLGAELKKIHPHLAYEIGPDVDGVRDIVISPDGFKEAIPVVQEVVKMAPTLPGWKVVAFRQPVQLLMTAYFGNVILPPEDLWFKATKKGAKVDLALYATGYLPTKKADYQAAAFQLLDHLLGEYTVMTRVGAVELDILPDDPPAAGLRPLDKLKSEFPA